MKFTMICSSVKYLLEGIINPVIGFVSSLSFDVSHLVNKITFNIWLIIFLVLFRKEHFNQGNEEKLRPIKVRKTS